MDEINDTIYDFDRITINKINSFIDNKEALKTLITPIIEKLIINEKPSSDKLISNIYVSCDENNNQYQCSSHRLIIPNEKKKIFIDTLINDITNPLKQKILLSGVLQEDMYNWFKFIKRPTENITLSIK